jgi:hypothetical protein
LLWNDGPFDAPYRTSRAEKQPLDYPRAQLARAPSQYKHRTLNASSQEPACPPPRPPHRFPTNFQPMSLSKREFHHLLSRPPYTHSLLNQSNSPLPFLIHLLFKPVLRETE